MAGDVGSKYNPYQEYTEEWEKWERAQRNKEYWDTQREPLTPRPPVTPSFPREVPDLPGIPNDSRNQGKPMTSSQFHTLGLEPIANDTNVNNAYYGQAKWDEAFAKVNQMMRNAAGKTKEDVPQYLTDIYNNLRQGYAGQKALGNFKFGNERRPDEGVSGLAGDVKVSGVTNAQMQRLQNQATRQDTMNAPAQVARKSMFDALQARVDKQLQLQGIQSEQSRDLALRKMIYEKQAGELKLQQMKDQIDTQYMNNIISTIGSTFANAMSAYGMWDQNRRAQAEVWPEQRLSNSASKFTNTWNANYMPWEG